MGTYYKIVNLDRQEYMEPPTFGQTTKVQEFTEDPAGIMEGLALLLLEGERGDVEGRWAGDRVVLASVYGEKGEDGLTLYRRVKEKLNYHDIGPRVLRHMAESRVTRRRLVERARSGVASERLRSVLDEIGVEWKDVGAVLTDAPEREERESMEQPNTPISEQPVPDAGQDPHGYILYVLNDLRSLVKDCAPSDEALLRRFDCIETAFGHTISDARERSDAEKRITYHVTAYAEGDGAEKTISSAIAMVKDVRVVETVSVKPASEEAEAD